jgi:FecR protein
MRIRGKKSTDRIARALFPTILVCCLLSAAAPSFASEANPFAGNIGSIESDSPAHLARITRAGKTAALRANVGDALFKGDTLKTDAGVKAQIQLSDDSLINVGPHSSLKMKDYLLDPSRSRRRYSIKALAGSIRFIIAKLFRNKFSGVETSWQNSDVAIETPTSIAGVRGTDLVVTIIRPEEVEVAVLDGLVSVRNRFGVVLLGPNQFSRIRRGARPAPPSALPPHMREGLIHQTTPNKPLLPPQRGAGAKAGKKRDAKEVARLIARQVAAGVPLKEIMSKAVEEGIDMETLVSAMIEAGLDAKVVVYTAITEGYQAQEVVKAAVKAGAPLEAVVSAALGAGADSQAVSEGAVEAGASPTEVANAISTASSPQGTAPAVYTPSEPVSVSGGGGGTPSTDTASPSQP